MFSLSVRSGTSEHPQRSTVVSTCFGCVFLAPEVAAPYHTGEKTLCIAWKAGFFFRRTWQHVAPSSLAVVVLLVFCVSVCLSVCLFDFLLLPAQDPPMVLPMYHIGMHQIAPEAPVQWRGRGKLCGMLPNVGKTLCANERPTASKSGAWCVYCRAAEHHRVGAVSAFRGLRACSTFIAWNDTVFSIVRACE